MKKPWFLLSVVLLIVLLGGIGPSAIAEEQIVATIYYSASTTCGTCVHRNTTLTTLETNYSDRIEFTRKNYDTPENKNEAQELGVTGHPALVINYQSNQTVINPSQIPKTTDDEMYSTLQTILNNYIEAYELANQEPALQIPIDLLLVLGGIAAVIILALLGFFIWKKENS